MQEINSFYIVQIHCFLVDSPVSFDSWSHVTAIRVKMQLYSNPKTFPCIYYFSIYSLYFSISLFIYLFIHSLFSLLSSLTLKHFLVLCFVFTPSSKFHSLATTNMFSLYSLAFFRMSYMESCSMWYILLSISIFEIHPYWNISSLCFYC